MRFYFVKNARIVAAKEIGGLTPEEAVATARAMFEEYAAIYDGVEVWNRTRRIFRLGRVAKPPRKPSKARELLQRL